MIDCLIDRDDDDDNDDDVLELDTSRCPPDFIQVNDDACYYPVSETLDWWQADEACSDLHPDAFPVAINDAEEQVAVLSVSSLLGQL